MSEETGTKMNYGTASKVGDKEELTEEAPKHEKIISGVVVERKQSLGRKIADTFTGISAREVATHVAMDVLLPQVKGMIVDAGTQAIERLILGDSAMSRRSNSASSSSRFRGGSSFTNYNKFAGGNTREEEPAYTRSNEVREMVVETRGDAQRVLDELFAIIDRYGAVSVATYYELVGITGKFTDNQWGWTNLNTAGVSRVREGFRIELPRPVSIK
jgi:hypothetical protein